MSRVRVAARFASLQRMTRPEDDLRTPLPHGVLSDMGRWTVYQDFRTFTWPWLLRRGILFWPLAILAGFAFGAWHSSGMGAWSDWPGLALRASAAALIAVTAGPLLATLVRMLPLPLALERTLVIAAILAGLWISLIALSAASAHHDLLMQQHAGMRMDVGPIGRAMSRFFYSSVDTSVIAWILAGGGLAVVYYLGERRRVAQFASRQQLARLRAERDAAEVRLAVLQAQVEPHFLFNTLASVRSLIQSEPARAEQVIDALGTYLRATLPRLRDGGAAETNLGGQLDLVSGYLDIMNVRMAGRIAVKVEADETVRALPFPPLILLTLVENAITHGLEPKVGPGMIAIAATADGETLTVSVEDDGVGLKPGVSNGLGLANIRAQLSSLFGARAALEVDARPEGGVSARIRVPLGDA
jgi:hypothetical protein